MRWFRNLALGAAAVTLAACGGGAESAGPKVASRAASWAIFRHLPGVADPAGQIVLASS